MSKLISLSKLNRFWTKGVKPMKDKIDNPIKTYDDMMANTVEGFQLDPLAAKEGFEDRIVKTYSHPSQFGCTSSFIPEICNAMPQYSNLIMPTNSGDGYIGQDANNKIPYQAGVLTIIKSNQFVRVEFNGCNSGRAYGGMCLANINLNTPALNGWFDLNNSLETATYYDSDVISITNEQFALNFARADLTNNMCSLYVSIKVPSNAAFSETQIATLTETLCPKCTRFLPCVAWGGRAVASVGVISEGMVNFAMLTPSTASESIDMYFETTYRII